VRIRGADANRVISVSVQMAQYLYDDPLCPCHIKGVYDLKNDLRFLHPPEL
jgi:hypothetical protein